MGRHWVRGQQVLLGTWVTGTGHLLDAERVCQSRGLTRAVKTQGLQQT